MNDRIYARYWIVTAYPLAHASATMAGEQSTGTFVRVPGETDVLRERYAAQVESIVEGEPVAAPTLPGSGTPANLDGLRRTAEVTLSWPLHNIGPSLPNSTSRVSSLPFHPRRYWQTKPNHPTDSTQRPKCRAAKARSWANRTPSYRACRCGCGMRNRAGWAGSRAAPQ